MWKDFPPGPLLRPCNLFWVSMGKILVASTEIGDPNLNAQEISNTFLAYLPCMTLMQTCLMC